ncbi:uncharacterized protein LOC123541168 [Mercenaria mercenaria]|uniref:uncharacterized protein LOC123541168 n=1 Tax=Mercenaria mercenaria TaxID=6596 RepID=UPI00234E9A58|nr:uncharacterized protein LOC123541168 [Mercenaria mercenaria]
MAVREEMDPVQEILHRSGLPTLKERFTAEKIDVNLISTLSDEDLVRLGVATIGDRIRLREEAKRSLMSVAQADSSSVTARLFPGFRYRSTSGRTTATKQKNKGGSWTAQFFCLSSRDQVKTPTSTEKEILNKTGLGLKKIKVSNSSSEEDIIQMLQSEQGFTKLKDSGGFEMLRTLQNGRTLVAVPCPWNSKSLKMNVGSQARIYLRPIQRSLSVEPVSDYEGPSVKVACENCKVEFSVHDLRNHIGFCGLNEGPNFSTDADKVRSQDTENHETEYYFVFQNANDTQSSNDRNAGELSFQNIVDNSEVLVHDTHSSTDTERPIIPGISRPSLSPGISNENDTTEVQVNESEGLHDLKFVQSLHDTVQYCINFCQQNEISNPVEMLRKIQEEIVIGRPLEVEDTDTSIEGETTFITIDRDKILETSMEEISSIPAEELRKTLEVQFYNELAADYGGPRKEFFRLVLIEIKEKYFDNGLRELLAPDYYTVGIILALSILQNGKMPVFLSPQQVAEIFDTTESGSLCVKNLRKGLNILGIYDLFLGLPELKFLLQPASHSITMKRITTLLKANFSEEGTNAYMYEKEVYSMFIKYLREVAAGRREKLTLASILVFACSTDEEPLLGFKIQPTIVFCAAGDGFLPTASTCVNSLTLPRATTTNQLPGQEELFKLYDYAFTNSFYGLQ